MSYDYVMNGLQITKDILIQCDRCGRDFFISTEEIEQEDYSENAPMGARTNYTFYSECTCPNCGRDIFFEQRASEYPLGAVEYVDEPTCKGGLVLTPPEVEVPNYDDDMYVSDDPIYSRRLVAEPVSLELSQKLFINVADGDANIGDQLYSPRKRATIWLNPAGRLLPILVEETGSIRFEENQAVFAEIIQSNPQIGAMRLLGKVAEAVLVRNCTDDLELNRMWLSKARKIRTNHQHAEIFKAIGTGLHSTKHKYPQKYSPSDPQRDIIWVNENGECALMGGGRTTAGVVAGLQVKVSGNGINYIRKSLADQRYEVPLVYFPINDDYHKILESINRTRVIVEPGIDFIDVRDFDENSFWEIQDYYPLLLKLFSGQISAERFVNEAINIPTLRNGVLATAMSVPKSEVRILH